MSEFITFFTLDSKYEEFCQKDYFLTVRKNKTFPLDAQCSIYIISGRNFPPLQKSFVKLIYSITRLFSEKVNLTEFLQKIVGYTAQRTVFDHKNNSSNQLFSNLFYLVKTLGSRIYCQRIVRVNLRNFHTL